VDDFEWMQMKAKMTWWKFALGFTAFNLVFGAVVLLLLGPSTTS
jgi:hypothetical protein